MYNVCICNMLLECTCNIMLEFLSNTVLAAKTKCKITEKQNLNIVLA